MNIVISNSGEIPIYEQIASQIKSAVIAGEVKPGEPLPSLRFLAKELRVSVISTKRAYEELEREGYITSVPGKGSFAAEINRELLREEQYKRLEEHLNEAVDAARTAGISLGEMKELLESFTAERQGGGHKEGHFVCFASLGRSACPLLSFVCVSHGEKGVLTARQNEWQKRGKGCALRAEAGCGKRSSCVRLFCACRGKIIRKQLTNGKKENIINI